MDFKFSIDEENIDKIIVECFTKRITEMCIDSANSWSGQSHIKSTISESFTKQITKIAEKVFSDKESIEAEVRTAIKEKIIRKLERMK